MRRIIAVAILLLIAWPAIADPPSGDAIIAGIKRAFASIHDYQADVSVTVKGPQVSINNMMMTLYFKKPNKIHIDAKQGFAMMPKGTFVGNPVEEFATNARATYLRTERNQGRECYVLKLSGEGPSRTLWVDKQRSVMLAAVAEGGFKTLWRYKTIDGKYHLPTNISAEMPNPKGGNQPVRATIRFSNYRVNKGISDKVFEQKKPASQQNIRKDTGRRDPD